MDAALDIDSTGSARDARAIAIDRLFTALDALRSRYPDGDPDAARRRGADAEKITGEVARQLGAARTRLSPFRLP